MSLKMTCSVTRKVGFWRRQSPKTEILYDTNVFKMEIKQTKNKLVNIIYYT